VRGKFGDNEFVIEAGRNGTTQARKTSIQQLQENSNAEHWKSN
jgi:hypothetical protein